MRLVRNSGFAGLSAMAPLHYADGVLRLRPFLDIAGYELAAYCQRHKLTYLKDPSNENTDFERVRMRQMLRALPDLEIHLAKLSALSKRMESALSDALAPFWNKSVTLSDDQLWVALSQSDFQALAPSAKVAVLRVILPAIGGQRHPPSFAATDRLIAALTTAQSRTLSGCLIRWQRDQLVILPEAGRGHVPYLVAKGQDLIYQGRLWVRARQDCLLCPMSESALAQMDEENSYYQALKAKPKEVAMIFPHVRALDEALITPHIKGVVRRGYRKHDDWPFEGVSIYPLGRLAKNV